MALGSYIGSALSDPSKLLKAKIKAAKQRREEDATREQEAEIIWAEQELNQANADLANIQARLSAPARGATRGETMAHGLSLLRGDAVGVGAMFDQKRAKEKAQGDALLRDERGMAQTRQKQAAQMAIESQKGMMDLNEQFLQDQSMLDRTVYSQDAQNQRTNQRETGLMTRAEMEDEFKKKKLAEETAIRRANLERQVKKDADTSKYQAGLLKLGEQKRKDVLQIAADRIESQERMLGRKLTSAERRHATDVELKRELGYAGIEARTQGSADTTGRTVMTAKVRGIDKQIDVLRDALDSTDEPADKTKYDSYVKQIADLQKQRDEEIAKLASPKMSLSGLKSFAASHGFTITSAQNGKHNEGSMHYQGKAIDVRTRGMSASAISELMRNAAAAGYKVRDERTKPAGQKVWSGPHIHLELP